MTVLSIVWKKIKGKKMYHPTYVTSRSLSDITDVINNIKFNQQFECFVCCLDSGLRIFNTKPLIDHYSLKSEKHGSMGNAEMLRTSNVVAMVAGGTHPKYAENTIMIYDVLTKKFIMEITFFSVVVGIRLMKNRLVAVLAHEIHIFNFPFDTEPLFKVETRENPQGICAVTPNDNLDRQLLCFPAKKCGDVQIVDLSATAGRVSQAPLIIDAHEGELACLSLNQDGSLLATASAKGTLIRVWDTYRRIKVFELRRGTDPASIYSINFSCDSDFLCCSSDKGTVHIFALKNTQLNRRSTFSSLSILGGYAESQWALANFSVPKECPSICAFGTNNIVHVVCYDGTFHKYSFTPEGNTNREAFDIFVDVGDGGFDG